jgi:CheY-like chemotaxis protein
MNTYISMALIYTILNGIVRINEGQLMKSDGTEANDRDSSIVGHVTGGTAHEFNNVLQGIIGLAEMLDADPSIPEKVRVGMKAIRRLGQNATRMMQRLSASEDMQGTTTSDDEDISAVADVNEPEPPTHEKQSILVVEDDQLVLNVITGMLKYLGYVTLRAHNGYEALDVFRDNSTRIGIVITDMVMPRMGGLELAKNLRTSNPEVKTILMTGYLQEELNIDLREAGLCALLEKPMTAERLREVVTPLIST